MSKQKQLKNDCLLLANMEFQKARHKDNSELQERAVKAWAHIIKLIETSY